ncbi:MAG: radical SAM protein, partial [Pseudomonas sp.]
PVDDLAFVDGKLVTEAVEINSAWHCNINCAWCSHGSPTLPQVFADEMVVGRDLGVLATWMTVDHVRVLGGEPLLHPRLPRLLEEIRSAQLSDRIRILTNGLMLAQAEAAIWDLVDEIHISVYPNTRRAIEAGLRSLQDTAAAANTTLVLKYFDRFRLAYRLPDDDRTLTERIYRTCQIGNVWRCLTVEHGHLYRCPQAAFQHRFHTPAISVAGGDYLPIHEIGSAAQVRRWLCRGQPLGACRGCAGSVGELRLHRQLDPRERRELLRAEPSPSQERAGVSALPTLPNLSPTRTRTTAACRPRR